MTPEQLQSLEEQFLTAKDPELAQWIVGERVRQENGLELIASENFASLAVRLAQGSVLTNKYAEGYPEKRYYGGCEMVDKAEALGMERLKKLFNCANVNVQAHSGSQANMAVFLSQLKPGDKIMGMSLSQGGHLTHGSHVNFSGILFKTAFYGLNPDTHRIDLNEVREIAKREQPKMIIAGASAYPRIIDFEGFKKIADEVGALFLVDMAHIAGLVAAGVHPTPIPHADFVTSTTHKTLRGPRGGIILSQNADKMKRVNSLIFPGIQGGPLMHVIAAKAVAFGEALQPQFKNYQQQTVKNAQALASGLMNAGIQLVSNGTDNHLMLLDLTRYQTGEITGKDAESWLGKAGITVNKNTVPNETRSPSVTSGIRIGTPAITTRGLKESEMKTLAQWIVRVLQSKGDESKLTAIHHEVTELCGKFPLPL